MCESFRCTNSFFKTWIFYQVCEPAQLFVSLAFVAGRIGVVVSTSDCGKWPCDNYNPKLHRNCTNISCMNFSGYAGNVTIFS